MPRAKTGRNQQLYTLRLNPTKAEHAQVIDIIEDWKGAAEGNNFGQIAVDSILRAQGYTPEMFPHYDNATAILLDEMRGLRGDFAQLTELILQRTMSVARNRGATFTEDDEAQLTDYARSIASGMQRRARQARSYDEVEDES